MEANFKDDVIVSGNNRKYKMITNSDGTVSFEDMTDYSDIGTEITADTFNTIAKELTQNATALQELSKYVAQELVKYIPTEKIVNTLLSTDASTVLSGPMGKQLSDQISTLNSALATLNGEVVKRVDDLPGATWGNADQMAKNKYTPTSLSADFYYPLFSIKTTDGNWSVGVHGASQNFCIVFATDDHAYAARYVLEALPFYNGRRTISYT